jgi:predicted DNA-binding helix-hairpin-helix protein
LRLDDIARLSGSVRRARPFIVTADHRPVRELDRLDLRAVLAPKPEQLSLFG